MFLPKAFGVGSLAALPNRSHSNEWDVLGVFFRSRAEISLDTVSCVVSGIVHLQQIERLWIKLNYGIFHTFYFNMCHAISRTEPRKHD